MPGTEPSCPLRTGPDNGQSLAEAPSAREQVTLVAHTRPGVRELQVSVAIRRLERTHLPRGVTPLGMAHAGGGGTVTAWRPPTPRCWARTSWDWRLSLIYRAAAARRASTPRRTCDCSLPGARTGSSRRSARSATTSSSTCGGLLDVRRFRLSTVSRRLSVVAGFYRTWVIDGVLEHSPADYVRRPTVPRESPTLGLTYLRFEALLTAARQSPNPFDFRSAVTLASCTATEGTWGTTPDSHFPFLSYSSDSLWAAIEAFAAAVSVSALPGPCRRRWLSLPGHRRNPVLSGRCAGSREQDASGAIGVGGPSARGAAGRGRRGGPVVQWRVRSRPARSAQSPPMAASAAGEAAVKPMKPWMRPSSRRRTTGVPAFSNVSA